MSANQEMYRYWVLEREETEEELTEEEQQRLERSKAWHPSQAIPPRRGRPQ
jgi:hypothetical protein